MRPSDLLDIEGCAAHMGIAVPALRMRIYRHKFPRPAGYVSASPYWWRRDIEKLYGPPAQKSSTTALRVAWKVTGETEPPEAP